MTLLRYSPLGFVSRTERALSWIPSVDVQETAERFVIRADLPGVPRENIEITAEGGVLEIRGSRKIEREEGRFERAERLSGTFVRRFTLPEDIDASAIKARYADGVLEVELPKLPAVQPRRIEVQAA